MTADCPLGDTTKSAWARGSEGAWARGGEAHCAETTARLRARRQVPTQEEKK